MLRYRIASCLVSAVLGILSLAQLASADTIGCSLTGYTFMGGANAYTNTEASHSKTYFLSQPLNMDYSGANYWGYAWIKFDDLGDATVGSAILHLNLLGVGSMSVTPASETNPTALAIYNPGATDVADLGGSDEASWTLRQTLRDTLDASSPFSTVTIIADGDVAIDITDLYNSWVSGTVENTGFVLCSSDTGNGGKYSSFGSAAGAPYIETTAVPEPGTIALLAALIGVGLSRVSRRRMVRKSLAPFFVVPILALIAFASPVMAEPGLLLIAHGAPNPEWNKPVVEFGRQIAETIKKEGKYKAVRTAMLEFAKPDIPTAVAELEAEGCDRIVAIPLFITPSGHTHFDVPAVLGIYSSPKIAATLAGEGAKAATPKVPITLTNTLAEGDVLRQYALNEVRRLSKTPKDEAIVILAHGDPEHQLMVERLLRQITTYCCGETGISYGDWASIGVGQEYQSQGVPTIKAALEQKKRVLVVGLYLSTTAEQIHQRGMKMAVEHHPSSPIPDANVAMSSHAIISQPELVRWVIETARNSLSPESTARSMPTRDAIRQASEPRGRI